MRIIRPTKVTGEVLTSSNVAEQDNPAWSSSTTYVVGDLVTRATTHRQYRSLQAANTGHEPTAASSATWWQDIGPDNRWAMFDDVVGTATLGPTGINVVLAPGAIDALAVLDTDAQTVNVQMTVGGTVIYSRSQSANVGGLAITDWSRYFFEPIGRVTTLLFLDLPNYPTASIAIAIKGNDPSGPVSCGTLVVGRQLDVGTTEASPTLEFTDYSVATTDQFGATSVVPRAYAKKMTTRSRIEGQQVDYVYSEIVKVRAKPVVWIGDEGFDAMKIYGFVKEFSVDVTYETEAYCSLTIQGLA